MKREVSCRLLQSVIEYFEAQNRPLDGMLEGVEYPMEHVRNKHEWIDWNAFCRIVSNLKRFASDEDFLGLGMYSVRCVPFRAALLAGRFLMDGPTLYRWWNQTPRGSAQHLMRCILPSTEVLDKTHIVVTLMIAPGYQNCREFFITTKGCFIAGTTLIGLGPSKVEMTEIENGARYDIECPPSSFGLQVRKAFLWPLVGRDAAQELKESNDLLVERYAQLEEMQAHSQRQATRLRVAYDVSMLVHKDPDLNSALQAIARSLVNVAGFAGARLTVDTIADGQHLQAAASAGLQADGSHPIVRDLEGRGEKIGEASLWLSPGSDANEAGDLLGYVMPIISMQAEDALSFTLVDDYRHSLQRKVDERTRELREANEALSKAQAVRDRFFANISHEFRTPLTLILGPAEQGLDADDPSTKDQKFHAIRENAARLLALVNQLLDFSRLESGSMKLQVSGGDIVQFLHRVVMSFESLAARKRIRLEIDAAGGPGEAFFDMEKLEKIVNNLMSNALKFTAEGGTVTVKVDEFRYQISDIGIQNSTPLCRIAVTDTGPGIAPEHRERIFERFYRVDKTHTIEGTGIGLALAKELVELHHGTIAVESTPGRGSTFTVTIPVDRASYTEQEVSREPPGPVHSEEHDLHDGDQAGGVAAHPAPPDDGKPVVLIVEDNEELRTYLRENLEREFGVWEAGDGNAGCERAAEIMPDLVVSDVMMPEMDGMEMCRIMKQDIRTSHIPIILLTARAGPDNRIEGLETGADDYVTKPFDMKELLVRARNLIDQRRELRKKYSSGIALRPGEVSVTSIDDALLKKVLDAVEYHMSNADFGVEDLAIEACMSRRQLSRKLNALTGLSPSEFIQHLRLQRAREMLEKGAGTVAEIAFQVGFTNPAYFSTVFHKWFDMVPSEISRRAH